MSDLATTVIGCWMVSAFIPLVITMLCYRGAPTVRERVFVVVFGAIAMLLSPLMLLWLLAELAGDGLRRLRRRL